MSNHLEIIEQLKTSKADFAEKLSKIENLGQNVSKAVLRDLIQHSRELHESAVILSYVLFNESEGSVQLEIPLNNPVEEEAGSVNEELSEEAELMDAFDEALEATRNRIEKDLEIEQEVDKVKTIIAEEEQSHSIVEEELPSMDEVVDTLENDISNVISMHSKNATNEGDNEKSEEDDNSLAAKLRKQKIEKLSTAIGINDKFLFTNELFNGNTEQFMQTIDRLDNCESLLTAQDILSNLATKNNWEKEDEPFLKLQSLIERKYQ